MNDGERYALIVASDTHTDPRLSRLRAPAVDAEELARVLSDPAIGAFGVATSLNEPEHVVRRRLSAFFENRSPDDLLVLHLSCHGVKDEDGRLYFATSDTEVEHLDATSIPADFVNRQMTRCRSRRIVLLLDCCYSGAFARGMVGRAGDRVDLRERFEGRGRIVLTASSAMEYSFEGDQTSGQGRPSVFTSAVVQGLATGEADRDRDGFISVDELYDFAYEQVRTVTPSQTPGKWVFDVQGDFYLARSAAGLPNVVPGLPGDLGAAMVSPFARIRRGAVEELAGLLTNPDASLAATAHEALVELTRDDSHDVSRAARGYVAEPQEPAPPEPAPEPAATEPPARSPSEGPVVGQPLSPSSATAEPGPPQPMPPEPTEVVPARDLPASRPSAARPTPVIQPTVPGWMPALVRAGAISLLGVVAMPLAVDGTMARWNLFAVMAPLTAISAAVLLWLVADGLRARRLPLPYAGGLLVAVGALTTAGAAGLISYSVQWFGGAAKLLGAVALLGALAALAVGISCVRLASADPDRMAAERSMMVLALVGTVLAAVALFIPYDGSSSLWDEVIEESSAAFAYLPLTAVLVLIVAVVLLGSRRQLAAGMLTAGGLLIAVHFVGVLLAASFAVGEVGEVRAAWIAGVAAGVLVGLAGWLSHQTEEV